MLKFTENTCQNGHVVQYCGQKINPSDTTSVQLIKMA